MDTTTHPSGAGAAATYTIAGQRVTMPVEVRDASSGVATYLVSSKAAQRLLPGDAFEVAETLPGRTPFALGIIDYRDNDLGDYNEVSMLFFVRPKGAPRGFPYVGALRDLVGGRLGTFIWKLPVDQSFTCEAGNTIWGFPKSVERIDVEYTETRVTGRLVMDGQEVFTIALPRGGAKSLPPQETTTYTYIDGRPHRTCFTQGGEGVGVRAGGATLTLGDHPLAGDLRSLGLPKRAMMTIWMEHMRGTFQVPEPLA